MINMGEVFCHVSCMRNIAHAFSEVIKTLIYQVFPFSFNILYFCYQILLISRNSVQERLQKHK